MTEHWAVVIGVGNAYRTDDGVGSVVALQIEKLDIPGVLVTLSDGEPMSVVDLWAGMDLAVVIDAVRCEPSVPGRVRRGGIDLLQHTGTVASSHTLGIQDALPLGRAIGRVPGRIVVIAVDAACLDLGIGLSEPVAAAVPHVVETVRAELRTAAPTNHLHR
ncbi:hydrogenase maturation protease [Nocardia beijingensis]|uniref:hydrogenase maturation protease n=1 Tax=Nocardia beijingensis TaxID=95162 RepID=UPI0018941316|nr:hydrogenase maturation protease [Nocardia beijingensis]MBF6469404.1 hydrogenase maturation protease [Nocardia beijingensis]